MSGELRRRPLLLATTNQAKLRRLRWVVEGLDFEVLDPADLRQVPAIRIPEDGADFAANAEHKARTWCEAAGGMLTLASDGGLVLPSLGETWNALRTRRNAGEHASGADRIAHLLDLMRPLVGEDRRAWWHEAVAVVHGDGAASQSGIHSHGAVWQHGARSGAVASQIGRHDSPTASLPVVGRIWSTQGDGGLIVEEAPPDIDPEFWTESIRYYPQVGKLYRDLSAADLAQLDTVWPYLRSHVRSYLTGLIVEQNPTDYSIKDR